MNKPSTSSIQHKVNLFLMEHGDQLSLLKNLLVFIPGRFGDSELMLEAIYSATNLFQTYIDYASSKMMLSHNQSTTSQNETVPPPYYLHLLKWIVVIQNLELCIEVLASSTGDKRRTKWPAIITIEALKALLRIKLLFKTNGNMLIHHSFHVPSQDIQALGSKSKSNIINRRNPYEGRRQTLQDQLQSEENNNDAHDNSTLIPLLPPVSPRDYNNKVIGELLYILRPLIYAVLRWNCGKKSWRPWVVSLLMEYVSLAVIEYATITKQATMSQLEMIEVKRRRNQFIYYVLRSPFYDRFISDGIVFRILNFFKKIPLIKILVNVFLNYINVFRTRYFYTSAS
ncbi:hypothetical protein SAMD00019534_028880, partial [Acytostelium subglobosum LB1]|uniref:hypothetical protein n=1 Tax=Acytostelium subglobosum LB1 TaxID=1410327 RepID=UPI000644E985